MISSSSGESQPSQSKKHITGGPIVELQETLQLYPSIRPSVLPSSLLAHRCLIMKPSVLHPPHHRGRCGGTPREHSRLTRRSSDVRQAYSAERRAGRLRSPAAARARQDPHGRRACRTRSTVLGSSPPAVDARGDAGAQAGTACPNQDRMCLDRQRVPVHTHMPRDRRRSPGRKSLGWDDARQEGMSAGAHHAHSPMLALSKGWTWARYS